MKTFQIRDFALLLLLTIALRGIAVDWNAPLQVGEMVALGIEADLNPHRWIGLVLSVLAPLLLAAAGARLYGRLGGWLAGAGLALGPLAVDHAGYANAVSPFLFLSSGILAALVAWRAEPRRWLLGLSLAGLALLILPLLWPDAISSWNLPGLRALPLSDPSVRSPLAGALSRLPGFAGYGVALFGLVGIGAAFFGGERARSTRLALAALGIALLIGLLRGGVSAGTIALTIPPAILVAVGGIVGAFRNRWLPATLFLAATAIGLVLTVGARWVPEPEAQTVAWVKEHLTPPSAVLVEHTALSSNQLANLSALPNLGVVKYPPSAIAPSDEQSLYYDPTVGRHFEWVILPHEPPVPGSDENANLSALRSSYDRLFREEWEERARFTSLFHRGRGTIILQRPAGWVFQEKWGPHFATLAARGLSAVREECDAYAEWALHVGTVLRSVGETSGARRLLDYAVAHRSLDPEAHFQVALIHMLVGDLDSAKRALLSSLSLDTTHGPVHYNLATLMEQEGDIDGAAVEYAAAILFLDDPTPAHTRLGLLLASLGRTEEALEQLQEVRRLAPGSEGEQILGQALGES